MRIALAQMTSTPGAFDAARERMLQLAGQAARQHADVVVFPATVLAGAYPMGLAARPAFMRALLQMVRDLAWLTPIPLVVPAYVQELAQGYTEVFLCADGTALPLKRRALAAAADANETDVVATCTINDVVLRFMAGEDPALHQDLSSCDVAIALSPQPFCVEDSTSFGVAGLTEGMYGTLAGALPCWLANVQGVGGYDDVVLAGGSFAFDPQGVVMAECPLFEEGVATFDVVPSRGLEGEPTGALVSWDEEASLLGRGPHVGRAVDALTPVSNAERTGFLYQALVVAVRDYVRKSGFADVIVGVSGGVDSALVAAIAVDALGPEHVTGVLMPGPFSSQGSIDDALELAKRLGFATRMAPITELFDASCPVVATALGAPFEGLARENLQARLRGTMLMAIANATGALVLDTTNKSEAAMGYSTLYGDTVGAFSPLADVYKGAVWDLCAWRNARGPAEVIPQAIIDKPPSAELSANQTDEASMGAGYDVIDRILYLHVERGMDADAIVAQGFEPGIVSRVVRSCMTAEYKRRQEPLGPVVSLCALSDLGFPVVCAWRDRACASGRDDALPAEGELDQVAGMLDALLLDASEQDQSFGILGDVAFSANLAGTGPDMDDCMGLPIFSKN